MVHNLTMYVLRWLLTGFASIAKLSAPTYSTYPFPDARQCPFCKAPIASSIQISQAHFTDVMSHICQFDDRCLGVNNMVQEGFDEEEDKEEEEEALLRLMAKDEEKSWMVAMAMAS